MELAQLLDGLSAISADGYKLLTTTFIEARENPQILQEQFAPIEGKRIAVGDVFTSCNWVLRDGSVANLVFGGSFVLTS